MVISCISEDLLGHLILDNNRLAYATKTTASLLRHYFSYSYKILYEIDLWVKKL
jgi:hypothetical protein